VTAVICFPASDSGEARWMRKQQYQARAVSLNISLSARRRVGIHCPLSDLRRRGRIALAKCAIEVRKITEPHIKRHRADAAIGKMWVAEEPVYARKALAENER
jgi:hypothetical protein